MVQTLGVHDPTIIEVNQRYYLFSTDTNQPLTKGIPIRWSDNLVDWQYKGTALSSMPQEATQWSKAEGLWAPEIVFVEGQYRMYYSASTFGSTISAIGLAVAESIEGPWQDCGIVVKTNPQLAKHNAIDANLCIDRQGEHWLVYGSFFGGIYIVAINKKTGKLKKDNDYGQLIAKRSQLVDGAIEGAFIYYHKETDYFYLFTSYDSLNDTYNIRVARSKEITGPYVDYNGIQMTDEQHSPLLIGTKLLGSYQWINELPLYAPGHNSIFKRSVDNQLFAVHHMRKQTYSDEFFLGVRKLYFLNNGWPVISGEFYQSEEQSVTLENLLGRFQIVQFNEYSDVVLAQPVFIRSSDLIEKDQQIYYKNQPIKAFLINQNGQSLITLVGMNQQGFAFIGRKLESF